MKVRKFSIGKWLALLLIFSLALATIFSLKFVDRFYVEKEQLLLDPGFLEGSRYWKQWGSADVTFQGNRMAIRSEATINHRVVQSVVGSNFVAPAYLRLTLGASSHDVVVSESDGAGGGVLMVYRDAQGKLISADRVVLLVGSHVSRQYSHTEYLADQPHRLDIIIRLSNSAGVFSTRDPVLSILQEFPFYTTMKNGLFLLWVIVALVMGITALRVLNLTQLVLLLLTAGVALVGTLVPEQVVTVISQKIGGLIPETAQNYFQDLLLKLYTASKLSNPHAGVSKVGHFLVFAGIGGVVGFYYRKLGLVYGLASVGVFALITETMQMFVIGRTASVEDILIDCFAGLLGVVAGVIAVTLIKRNL